MKRNWFLGDVLSQLYDRPRIWRGARDTRSLSDLAEALLSTAGEASGYQLATSLLEEYAKASEEEKLSFFIHLNEELEIDASHVAALASSYAEAPTTDGFKAFSEAAEPRRQELLRRLNQPEGATERLVAMRADLLRFRKSNPALARTDHDFRHLLRSWFNRGFLVARRITWDSPARILDKIVAYEAVHAIEDLDDLRRRIEPEDRRCFAFFHPSMPEEPLIFVEVALTLEISGSIDHLLRLDRAPKDAATATHAIFYSISNCQEGLAGISFGNLLIKQVVFEIAMELPSVTTFSTLSPIPGLKRWMDEAGFEAHSPKDYRDFAAQYLTEAKRKGGEPLDPVARFHLGNGAELHNVHPAADGSEKGLAQSGGAMVNYLYDLSKTERQHEAFATSGTVAASRAVLSMAAGARKKTEDTAA
ncbi:MAG: malonyl-CoA decarboxylase [Rhodobacteraceae bacterium]|nr:malonyl-CoA decarboxylase [Paracoccaceae bacterium]